MGVNKIMETLEYIKELKLKYKEDYGTIRRLSAIEKELKALAIIKKYDLCEEGIIAEGMRSYNKFSKEESELLMEVLK